MPLETVVSPPQVEWWTEVLWPNLPAATIPAAYSAGDYSVRGARNFVGAAPSTTNNLSTGATGGGGVTTGYAQPSLVGRISNRGGSTGANWAQGWLFPWWIFQGDGGLAASGLNPGYSDYDGARIARMRIGFALDAIDATLNVGTGFYFTGWNGDTTGMAADRLPGGPNFGGGVGLVCDGAGGWQYVSHDAAGLLLESVAVPPAALPDVVAWSTADFTFRASPPGAPGWLSLDVNGVRIVDERPYGPLLLPTRLLGGPGNTGQQWTYAMLIGSRNPGTGTFLRHWWWGRWGRFRPDGREVG